MVISFAKVQGDFMTPHVVCGLNAYLKFLESVIQN